ncbi:MAG: Holliday junction branch migration protein RuvA, partial [Anaerolineales bacterium]
MIANLSGRILEITPNNITIDMGGVGLDVYVTSPFLEKCQAGEKIFLFTMMIVREDSLTLYGFESKEEKQLFSLLLGVNGVGPRSALNILSVMTPDELRHAILQGKAELIFQVPGIGKKTAQKIILQLQDQFPSELVIEFSPKTAEADAEVLDALTSLGYS